MAKANAQQKIKEWLQSGKTLTAYMALEKFNHFRLAVVVQRLRKQGIDIQKHWRQTKTTRWAEYFIPNAKPKKS